MERRGLSGESARAECWSLWARFAALFRGKRVMRHATVFLRTIRVFDRHARLTRTKTFTEVMGDHLATVIDRMTVAEARELAPLVGLDSNGVPLSAPAAPPAAPRPESPA